jgi:hypothetical protein
MVAVGLGAAAADGAAGRVTKTRIKKSEPAVFEILVTPASVARRMPRPPRKIHQHAPAR